VTPLSDALTAAQRSALAMKLPRYEVHSVTGYPITQGWKRARDQKAGTTYFIERNCARLNREHDEWLTR
jgi:hypothetical protein